MFDELLRFGLVFVLVLLFVFLVSFGGAVEMEAILEGLFLLLFGFIVEMGRGDESDELLERVFGIFPDEKVYESRYATEQALKVTYDQGRSKFGWR